MIRNKNSSVIFEEEIKCEPEILNHFFPSISQTTKIEIILNQDRFSISKHNPLFHNLYSMLKTLPLAIVENNTIISITLPCTVNRDILEIYFLWLTSSNPPLLELSTTYQLISLCVFFLDKETLEKVIVSNIEPNIDKNTGIDIIKFYYPYVNHECFGDIFSLIVNRAIDMISHNLFFVISNMRDLFLQLDDEPFERIIGSYFKSVLFNPNIDHSLIMGVLMSKRDITDIFELLEHERKNSILTFENLLEDEIQPSLKWIIQTEDPKNGLYIENDEFTLDNFNTQIIACYDQNKDIFNIALKIMNIKEEEETHFSQRLISKDDSSTYINNFSSNNFHKDSSQFIISLLSICEIPELDFKSKINFNCIFSNSQTKVLICRIENFNQKFNEKKIKFDSNVAFTLKIFFNISYNFSSILTHICKNFYQYHSLTSVKIMPKNVLNIILRNEDLNIQSEDEVLIAVLNWLNYRSNQTSELLLEIVKNMNWNLVSVEGLFDFLNSQGKIILGNQELQEIISKELNSRFKKDNYIVDDNSFVETKIKLKRKYIPSSKTGPRKNFASELLLNILKILTKNNNNHNSMSNTITGIFQHDETKKLLMNFSEQELADAISLKNSVRNSQSNYSNKGYEHNSLKINTNSWKNIISPISNQDNFPNRAHFSSERLVKKEISSYSILNRNKIKTSAHNNKSRISEYSNREENTQSKSYAVCNNNIQKEDKCPNRIISHHNIYPHYVRSSSNCKTNTFGKPNLCSKVNQVLMTKKKKITNLIKIAKRESRENSLNRKFRGSRTNFNSLNKHNYIKSNSKTRSFMD